MADPSRAASVGDGLDGLKRVGLPASAHQRLDAQARDLVELPYARSEGQARASRPQPSLRTSLRAQRRPLYAVPVFVLTVPPQTVQRYRQRRPNFVGNEPWPTMLKPSFPRLSHPRLAQAIPSIACIAQVYLGETAVFAQDLGGEGDRSTATGASTQQRLEQWWLHHWL